MRHSNAITAMKILKMDYTNDVIVRMVAFKSQKFDNDAIENVYLKYLTETINHRRPTIFIVAA